MSLLLATTVFSTHIEKPGTHTPHAHTRERARGPAWGPRGPGAHRAPREGQTPRPREAIVLVPSAASRHPFRTALPETKPTLLGAGRSP